MDNPDDQSGHAREHDWAALPRELRHWPARREEQLEEGLDLGPRSCGRKTMHLRVGRTLGASVRGSVTAS